MVKEIEVREKILILASALTTTGKTYSHQFTKAGDFPYFCELHLAERSQHHRQEEQDSFSMYINKELKDILKVK